MPGDDQFRYDGTEFEALADASNYYRWIVKMFGPHLAGHVLEVGAGQGNFAVRALESPLVERMTLIEPDARLHSLLSDRFADNATVQTELGFFGPSAAGERYDAIVAVNVVEHIEDDVGFVQAAYSELRPGGRLCVFVPAGPRLFGTLDTAFDHYRRYTRRSLETLFDDGGFGIDDVRYANLPGVVAWSVAGKVLRQRTIRPNQMKLYDRFAIPVISRIERLVRPPRGQSLVAVGTKPSP